MLKWCHEYSWYLIFSKEVECIDISYVSLLIADDLKVLCISVPAFYKS